VGPGNVSKGRERKVTNSGWGALEIQGVGSTNRKTRQNMGFGLEGKGGEFLKNEEGGFTKRKNAN